MRVLIACEYSGIVRDAFTAAGHEALSCDLLPTESPGPHHQGDVRELLHEGWDLMIAHPPCQYLSYAGTAHWNAPGRAEKRDEALKFLMELYHAPIEYVAIENPKGWPGQAFRPADQYINPYEHGDPTRKRIGLWLKGMPPLIPTKRVEPPPGIVKYRRATGKVKLRHETDNVGGSKDRWKERSKFFPGIAAAMAQQWGDLARLARLAKQTSFIFS